MSATREEPLGRIFRPRAYHASLSPIRNAASIPDDQKNVISKKHRIKHQRRGSFDEQSLPAVRLSLKEMSELLKKATIETEQIVVAVEEPPTTTMTTDAPYLRQCATCVGDVSMDQYVGLFGDQCAHIERTICNKCLYEHVKCIVDDWNLFEETIRCPETSCTGRFDFVGIRQILIELGQNTPLFEQYEMRLMQRSLEQMPEFIWCTHGCGSGQLHGFDPEEQPVVECVKCKGKTCFKHGIRWHTDLSCDEYDIQNGTLTGDEATDRWLDRFTKMCPECEYHIQKNDGCDHMTCRYCKHEFCWECLVDYRVISTRGAREHLDTCSHYEPPPLTPVPSINTNIPTVQPSRRIRSRCEVQ